MGGEGTQNDATDNYFAERRPVSYKGDGGGYVSRDGCHQPSPILIFLLSHNCLRYGLKNNNTQIEFDLSTK